MRSIALRRHSKEEDESVFVSMTDMTISFLIILMILLAFFASRFTDEDMVPRLELEEAQRLLVSLQETIALLSVRAPITSVELAALRLDLQQARLDLDVTQSVFNEELERLEAELTVANHHLAIAQTKLSQLESELTSSENSLRAVRSTIDALNETIRQLQEELALLRPLRSEVERLRQKIIELELVLDKLRLPDPLEEYLVRVAQSREIALRDLRDAIRQEFPDLQVVISSESDALRFQGEGLFKSNARALTAEKRRIVERISELLDGILPCYSLGKRSAHNTVCNPGYAVIEAVQIEGHTDSRGSVNYNIGLASDRAVSTFLAMSEHVSGLLDHTNLDGEPVLSVAGYGEARPVAANNTPEGRSTNRRIDLRFIMYSPNRSEEIEIIRRQLADGAITTLQP